MPPAAVYRAAPWASAGPASMNTASARRAEARTMPAPAASSGTTPTTALSRRPCAKPSTREAPPAVSLAAARTPARQAQSVQRPERERPVRPDLTQVVSREQRLHDARDRGGIGAAYRNDVPDDHGASSQDICVDHYRVNEVQPSQDPVVHDNSRTPRQHAPQSRCEAL